MLSSILVYTDIYKEIVNGKVTYDAIDRSKKKWKTKKLILGDSVGDQLFSDYKANDTLISLATLASISMAGQYILLNNYLTAGNQLDHLYLVFNPNSFKNNIEGKVGYCYFLKPFYISENQHLYTETAIYQIDKMPFKSICQNPVVKISGWAPDNRFFLSDYAKDKNSFLSDLSLEYLIKMKELGFKHHFSITTFATPVIESNRMKVEELDKSAISKNNLDTIFKNYFENIIYLDSSFFVDEFHLNKPENYTIYYKRKMMD